MILQNAQTKRLVSVHGWSGVILGLILYAVIVTGTAAVFKKELTTWSAGSVSSANPVTVAPITDTVRRLAAQTPTEYHDDLNIFPTLGNQLQIFFHKHFVTPEGETKEKGVRWVVDAQRNVVSRDEGIADQFPAENSSFLGHFFVDLHVRLHLPNPYGLILTGILGLAMLVAAVSGLLIHGHLIRDLFTIRQRKEKLVAWRDLHTVAATWTLPHAFILAFTGAYFSFAIAVGFPLLAKVAFNGDREAAIAAFIGAPPHVDPTPAPLGDLDAMIADAKSRIKSPIFGLIIEHFGRADAKATVRFDVAEDKLVPPSIIYSAATGGFVMEKPVLGTTPSVGSTALMLMGPLHFGNFAGWLSKAAWFALGAASAYVTISGLALFVRKRREQRGARFLGAATSWMAVSLPLAMSISAAGFFLSKAAGTSEFWTAAAFLISAAASLLIAIMYKSERSSKILLALLAASLLGLAPLRLMTGGLSWVQAIQTGQSDVIAVDLLVTLGGVLCGWSLVKAREEASIPSVTSATSQAAE